MSEQRPESSYAGLVRVIARTWATLSVLLILAFLIGEGLSQGMKFWHSLTPRSIVLMIALATAWLGLLVSWRWEWAGGLLTLGATAAFYLLHFCLSASLPRGPFFLILTFPCVLFLYCAKHPPPKQLERSQE